MLAHIGRSGADQIVCLGDVATLGPAPQQIIETLADLGCTCILGNHDAFLLDPELIHRYTNTPVIVAAVDACRAALGPADLDFLRTFRPALDLEVDGATLSLFHGSPRSHMEDLLSTTSADALDRALGEHRATVMAGGNTHIQMVRQHHGTLLVNLGSLGAPFETYVSGGSPKILAHAEYATVEAVDGSVSVTLHRVPLDRANLIADVERWDNPLQKYLLKQYMS